MFIISPVLSFPCEEFKVSDSGVFVPPDGVGGAAHE